MTREEAILCLKGMKNYGRDTFTEQTDWQESLDMAIKALEQEPCEDWHDVPSYEMILEQARQAVKYLRKKLAEYLWQQPCEDCISRKNTLAEFKRVYFDNDAVIRCAELVLGGMPPVTPQQKLGHSFPEGATNKDIFKAIFGYEPATDSVVCNKEDWCGASEPCNYCINNSNNIGREEDWWNAPYKKARESRELEKQQCEDCISRQVVKEQMIKYGFNAPDMTVTEFVESLPPITPQPKYEDIAKAFQLGLVFGFGEKHDEMDKVIEDIKKGITPQPKIGRWWERNTYPQECRSWNCSECQEIVFEKTNYCPNCGAKMQEVEE